MNAKEGAAYVGLCYRQFRALVLQGKIPVDRSNPRAWKIEKSALDEFKRARNANEGLSLALEDLVRRIAREEGTQSARQEFARLISILDGAEVAEWQSGSHNVHSRGSTWKM